jgi:hypothetical protein
MMFSGLAYGQAHDSLRTEVSIYEYGKPVTSCECNFENLLSNWNRWIVNRDEIKLLSYQYVETLKDEARIARYAGKMYGNTSTTLLSSGGTTRSFYNETKGVPEYRFYYTVDIGTLDDLINRYKGIATKAQLFAEKAEMERIFGIKKEKYFETVHVGDKVYLLKFEVNEKACDYYVICNPTTKKVLPIDDFLTKMKGERTSIENSLNSQTSNFAAFEWNLNKNLPQEQDKYNLYGFNTVSIPENERQKFKDMPAGQIEEMKNLNTVLADDFSSYRFYYPFSDALVEYEEQTYTADKNGAVTIPNLKNVYKISITGREKSGKVAGGMFKYPVRMEKDSHVMFGQSTVLYDCGEFQGME